MYWLVQTLVPIAICVVLPVLVVWIFYRHATNRDNKNAEIIIKAIENNSAIDADKLIEALGKPGKTPLQILQQRLLRGCIFSLLGIVLAIFTIIIYNQPDTDPDSINAGILFTGISLAIGISYLVVYFLYKNKLGDPSREE